MRLKVDHVTVCGSDLAAMRGRFADAGLATGYGGPHAHGVTHMDQLAFRDGSYLELIAPVARGGTSAGMVGGWAKLMEGNAGAGAWAAQSEQIHRDAERFRSAGIEVRGPEAGSRRRPDGIVLEWEIAAVGTGAAGSVLPFLIQDRTPRSLRVPSPARLPVDGVAAVVLGIRDLGKAIALFRSAYGLEKVWVETCLDFGAELAHFPETPVILAAPVGEDSWLHGRLDRFGECPAAFLLATRDLAQARRGFSLAGQASFFGRKLDWFDEDVLGSRIALTE
jgi:hypothetical protein